MKVDDNIPYCNKTLGIGECQNKQTETKEDYKAEITYAAKYGMVRGLMDGLMKQAMDMGDYYSIEAEVFEQVEKAMEELDKK